MKKLLFMLLMIFIVTGFAFTDDHTNPFTGEETVYDQVCRVYDVDDNGIIDGTELTTEEFTLMHLQFRDKFKAIDFRYRNRVGRMTACFNYELPDEPQYGPRRFRR